MSYHISTYGYTHKMIGCKRTRLDFGKPYRKEKTKNAKVASPSGFEPLLTA